MSLQACADIVAKGDADRFAAVMAAPVAAREKLLPIYAFNVEVARAPWVASEPMIGEMRLQWWRDALEEIAEGKAVRKHEVTTPLAKVLDAEGARLLDKLIQARRWDLYTDAFEDAGHFDEYLDATGGGLMWASARALGATDQTAFRALGRASALANLFLAVPELEARGRKPMVDGRGAAISELAGTALKRMSRSPLPKAGRAAGLSAWRARPLLRRASKAPQRVVKASLEESEFQRRWSLIWAAYRV
ncbi:squalene/phytoene synthase family protein [Rhodobacteraceae bacterium]|nr:squalene/phytoene synthase family protein [Paracoccaceae bacterium]